MSLNTREKITSPFKTNKRQAQATSASDKRKRAERII